MSDNSDNWLRTKVLDCQSCGARLFRVDHSPFCDDYRLYCDSCPQAIEISFYDKALDAIQKGLPSGHDRIQLMQAIEPRLRPCSCGGHFKDHSPRRCFSCKSIVIAEDAAGVDLSPYTGVEDQDREPTETEQRQFDAYLREFVHHDEDLWA